MTMRPRRSALYLPASRESAITKARTLPCDIVILDLEDAVSPEDKPGARKNARGAADEGGFGSRELLVRVNALDTSWGGADVEEVKGAPIDGLLLPKVSSPADFATARALAGHEIPLWAMIETCAAVLDIAAIASAARTYSVAGFVIGTNDLALEIRCSLDEQRSAVLPFLVLTVAAARANGLAVLDGVFNDIDDAEGFAVQCRQGEMLGFDGKTLIHPSQIETANRTFAPTADQLARALDVVAGFAAPENEGKGVLRVGGKMTERLHLVEAQRLLAVQQAIEAAA